MKKNYLLLVLVVMAMTICSCTNKDYQKAIPANAQLVIRVQFGNIAENADLQHSDMMKNLEMSLDAAVKKQDKEQVKAYLEDPSKMGIDFSEPAYLFMVDNSVFGMTMKVDDDGALNDFIELMQKQHMATKPVDKEGLMCGTLFDEIHYSFDANTCLLMASPKGRGNATISRMARELMQQKESDSFIDTDGYDRLDDVAGDVSFYTNIGNLPKEVYTPLLSFLPENLKPGDLDIVADLNFEKGKATFLAKVYGNTSDAKKIIKDADDELNEIEGAFIDKVSGNMMMWMAANVNGEWLLKHLKSNATFKELLFGMERAIDIEQMLKAVDGDMALELQPGVRHRSEPEYMAYAQIKNSDFLGDVDYWKKSMKDYGITMNTLSKDQYQINIGRDAYVWGVEGKNLFMGSANADRVVTGQENLLKPYAKEIKDSKFFLYYNLEMMAKDELQHHPTPVEKKIYEALKAVVAKAPSAAEMSITVVLKNEDENFLKQLF